MSNMDDAMRKLGAEWNAEDDGTAESEMMSAIGAMVHVLTIVRRLIVSTGQSPKELLATPVFMSGISRMLAEETGFSFESMLGFVMCALAIEEVEGGE